MRSKWVKYQFQVNHPFKTNSKQDCSFPFVWQLVPAAQIAAGKECFIHICWDIHQTMAWTDTPIRLLSWGHVWGGSQYKHRFPLRERVSRRKFTTSLCCRIHHHYDLIIAAVESFPEIVCVCVSVSAPNYYFINTCTETHARAHITVSKNPPSQRTSLCVRLVSTTAAMHELSHNTTAQIHAQSPSQAPTRTTHQCRSCEDVSFSKKQLQRKSELVAVQKDCSGALVQNYSILVKKYY